jgi:archaellum component FlaF (FlaF/FlaG flagellin family)
MGTVSPTSLSFGKRTVGTKSTAKTVTLTNSGAGALDVSSITTTGGFIETNTCTSALLHGNSCSISVKFAPTVVGTYTGPLKINDNAGNTPQIVSLNGKGIK